jgi:hypothetical protein
MALIYETDSRGRCRRYVPEAAPAPMPAPAMPVPVDAFTTEERADGLHIVDAAGHSWGIASTPLIAAAQVAAALRFSR